jgi:DNA-binding NarL/FixJ family response regulator
MSFHNLQEQSTRLLQEAQLLLPHKLFSRVLEQLMLLYSAAPAESHPAPQSEDNILYEMQLEGQSYYIAVRAIREEQRGPMVSLSPRELSIARLIAQGLPNKHISLVLEISPYTVATHLRRIFVKLGVSSRAAMVARLHEKRLLYS